MLNGAKPGGRPYRFDDVIVDCDNFAVEVGGQVQNPSPRAFDVLLYLIEHRDRVVGKQELFESIWKEAFVTDSALTQVVKELRHAIGDDAQTPRYIETVHKRGYRFIAAVAPVYDRRPEDAARRAALQRRVALVSGAIAAVVGVLLGLNVAGLRDRLSGTAPATEIQSIAVLPLKNLSGDPEQEYFADGMTEALITELGKISALRVISIQSTLQYKGTDKPTPQIAGELNVDALMEGSVLRWGNRVRVNTQLVQASPERHLWSQSFERDVRDVLSLQGNVAREVARHINVTVRPEEKARLASTQPVDPGAYEDFLRGLRLYSAYPTASYRAIQYFQQALKKDSNFAPAHAALANSYAHHMGLAYDEAFPQAEAAARRAIQLDTNLAEAHCAEAYVAWRFRWDWPGADRAFRRGLQLNANSAACQSLYGFYLTLMGRFEEAETAHKRALELDPFNPNTNFMLPWHYGKARRDDEALARLRELRVLYPERRRVHYMLAHAYARKGMYAEALGEAEEAECRADCGWVYAILGRRKEARQFIDELQRASKHQYVDPGYIALIYAGLGEKDQALKWLEEGYRRRARWMMFIKVLPTLDSLRSEPRFRDLLRRVNFPD